MAESTFKHDLFSQFARVAKALGHAHRIELLEFVAQGENSVENLARRAGLSIANTSQHLRRLRDAGLLDTRRDGQFVFYRIAGDEVLQLLEALRGIAVKRLAEVQRLIDTYLTTKDELEPVQHKELLDRVRKGLAVVIDVRPADEYQQGHIPRSINLPLDKLKKRLGEFSSDQDVIAYCRGPFCLLAFEAVAMLRERGIKARRLADGFPEWQLGGFPVERE